MTRAPSMIVRRYPITTLPSTPGIEIANRFMAQAPVDLIGMAKDLGLSVNMKSRLGPNISGKITKKNGENGDSFLIEVNEAHSENRRRFTLAHEISHYLLHRHLMGNGLVDNQMYRSGLSDRVESEANRLAAELLMPASLVRAAWRGGNRSISKLAQAFEASDDAMRIRVEQLGLTP